MVTALDNLRAIRHLPPNTILPKSDIAEIRECLAELVALPETSNPLDWLKTEWSDFCIRYYLQEILNRLKQKIASLHYIITNKLNLPPKSHQLEEFKIEKEIYQNLLLLDLTSLFAKIPENQIATTDVLRFVWQELIRLRQSASKEAVIPNHYQDTYIDFLILPDKIDSLEWLKDHYLDIAIEITLERVVESAIPQIFNFPEDLILDFREFSPPCVKQIDSLEITLNSIAFRESGCQVAIKWVMPSKGIMSTEAEDSFPFWTGLTQITDNLGYSYLIQTQHVGGNGGTWYEGQSVPYNYQHIIFFYPTLTANVTEITFISKDSQILLSEKRGDEIHQVPSIKVKNIIWEIKMPNKFQGESDSLGGYINMGGVLFETKSSHFSNFGDFRKLAESFNQVNQIHDQKSDEK